MYLLPMKHTNTLRHAKEIYTPLSNLNEGHTHAPLNRYDILKVIAIVLMVIDHLTIFFLEDRAVGQPWLGSMFGGSMEGYDSLAQVGRAIGRWSLPLFVFLVGYRDKFHRGYTKIIVGAGILSLFQCLTTAWVALGSRPISMSLIQSAWNTPGIMYQAVFFPFTFTYWPFNVLWTIMFARLVLWGMTRVRMGVIVAGVITVITAAYANLIYEPSFDIYRQSLAAMNQNRQMLWYSPEYVLEYGLIGICFAIAGYVCYRSKDKVWNMSILGSVIALHGYRQIVLFGFGVSQALIVAFGFGVIVLVGGGVDLQKPVQVPYAPLYLWVSRHAMVLYIGHLVLLGILYQVIALSLAN
jgi:hypothetical protein